MPDELPEVRQHKIGVFHTVPLYLVSRACDVCFQPAGHRIEDISAPRGTQKFGQFLCCMCMATTLGANCGLFDAT